VCPIHRFINLRIHFVVGMETILTLCAHNDDQIIGAGGTLTKYAREGKRIRTVIFSFGESSHPHLKPQVIMRQRIKESLLSDKIMGGSGVAYLGLKEGRFFDEFKRKGIKGKIRATIAQERPSKIFTHSANDPHPDHHAAYCLVQELVSEGLKVPVFTFDVWSLFKWRNIHTPRLVVDMSETFDTKIRALMAHKSQKLTIVNLLWSIYVKAVLNGWRNKC